MFEKTKWLKKKTNGSKQTKLAQKTKMAKKQKWLKKTKMAKKNPKNHNKESKSSKKFLGEVSYKRL